LDLAAAGVVVQHEQQFCKSADRGGAATEDRETEPDFVAAV